MTWTSPQSRPNYPPQQKTAADYVRARQRYGKQPRRGVYFSKTHRRAVILRLAGFSLNTIGDALGISKQAVHGHLVRRGKVSHRAQSFWICAAGLAKLGISPALCEFLGAVPDGAGYMRKLRSPV